MKTLLTMMPLCSQSPRRPAMRVGRDQMNGSTRNRSRPVEMFEPISQTSSTASTIATCRSGTSMPRLPRARGIAAEYLLAQVGPHPFVDVGETGHEARLHYVARSRQVHGVIRFQCGFWTASEQQHAIG